MNRKSSTCGDGHSPTGLNVFVIHAISEEFFAVSNNELCRLAPR